MNKLVLALVAFLGLTSHAYAQVAISQLPDGGAMQSTDTLPAVRDGATVRVKPSGFGSVSSVGMTGDGVIYNSSVTGSPITGNGSLVPSLATHPAGMILATPSGSAGAPTFRSLVGTDLPTPGLTSLGGAKATAPVTHQFLTGLGTDGTISQAQPAASDVSGLAASATTDTTNASNISSGNLDVARLPSKVPAYSGAISGWGDSLTYGGQSNINTNGTSDGHNWPGYLQGMLGRVVKNAGWPGQNSTQIAARFLNAPNTYNDYQVIWSGRNDDFSQPSVTLANIASMVAALPAGSRYVVMTIVPAQYEPTGNATRTNLNALNAAIIAAYPNNYLDISSLLIADYNPANPADVANNAAGLTPVSLRSILSNAATTTAISTTSTCSFTVTIPGSTPHNGDIMLIGSEYITLDTVTSGGVVSACTRGYGGTTASTYTNGTTFTAYDYLHFNAAGYQFIATQLASYINSHDPLANAKSSSFASDNNWNTFTGFQALGSITSGVYNVANGGQSGASMTTGYYNDLSGHWSGFLMTTAHDNSAHGFNTLANCTSCSNNSTSGTNALQFCTTCFDIVANGIQSGQKITTGHDIVLSGVFAGLNMTTASYDNCIGVDACFATTTGAFNNMMGYKTGFKATGSNLLILGDEVGSTTLVSGINDILIGVSSAIDTSSASESNAIHFGGTGGDWWTVTGTNTNTTESATGHGSFSFPDGSGLQIGSPTGGLKGAGTINATTVYQNGVQVANATTSGTFASKPASPTTGQHYFATDLGSTGLEIIWTGSVWKPLGGIGVIYQSGVQQPTVLHTGDTTESNAATVTIPAGLLSANGSLRIWALGIGTGTNGTKTFNVRWGANSGSITDPLVYSIAQSSTVLSTSMYRAIFNRNSVSSQVSLPAGNNFIGTSTLTNTTFTLNTASTAYLNFNVLLANSADAAGYSAIMVEWIEP